MERILMHREMSSGPRVPAASTWRIARFTFREAVRKKAVLGAVVLTALFLLLYATGLYFAFQDIEQLGRAAAFKDFIAGQLHHARGMCAVLSPLVNSYKRLVPGYEAPVYISWARVNRSALIRVPRINPKRIKATRIELRCPDPSCNPYLAFAVMLKCGLDGIKKKMPLPEPVEENLYHFDEKELARRQIRVLPGSLEEALAELQKDTVVQEALGEHVYERFLEAKKQEWDAYRMYVSQWELDRYLEVF